MIDGELIVDNFAGGGWASTGIELATGHSVDIAINHDFYDIMSARESTCLYDWRTANWIMIVAKQR